MPSQVGGVAHQEQRSQIVQKIPQPGQPAAHIRPLLGAAVTGGAQRHQVLRTVGLHRVGEQTEGNFVMDVVCPPLLGRAAHPAAVSIAGADLLPQAGPIGAVIVGSAAPQPRGRQSLHRGLIQRQPEALGEHLLRGHLQGEDPQGLARFPMDLAVPQNAARYPEFSKGATPFGEGRVTQRFRQFHMQIPLRTGEKGHLIGREQVGAGLLEIQGLHQVRAGIVQVNRPWMDEGRRAGGIHRSEQPGGSVERNPPRRSVPQPHFSRRCGSPAPVVAPAREMQQAALGQVFQVRAHLIGRQVPETRRRLQREFGSRALQVVEQDEGMVGVDQGALRRLPEDVLRVAGEILFQRRVSQE